MAKMSPYEKRLYTEFNLTLPQARAVAKDVTRAIKKQKKAGLMASADFTAGREARARDVYTLSELGRGGGRLTSTSAKAERGRTVSRATKKSKKK